MGACRVKTTPRPALIVGTLCEWDFTQSKCSWLKNFHSAMSVAIFLKCIAKKNYSLKGSFYFFSFYQNFKLKKGNLKCLH